MDRKNTDFIWLVEHNARELDIAALCSLLMEKKGITTKILPINKPDLLTLMKGYSPKVILFPFFYTIQNPVIASIVTAFPKAILVNLSWEQIFYQANEKYKLPRDIFAKTCVYQHCWSKKRADLLIANGVSAENIFINGQPVYKLYEKPYKALFERRNKLAEEFNLDKHKTWVFFPENYSWFFYSPHNIKEIIKSGHNSEDVKVMRLYCQKAFYEVMDWMEKLFTDNKIEMIIRPRPATPLSKFRDKVQEINPRLYQKAKILKDYTVREWILSSDIIVSSFSTCLIEATIAKKPIYMLEPSPIPTPLQAYWYDYIDKITSADDISGILEKKQNYHLLLKWAKSNFFGNQDTIYGLSQKLIKILRTGEKPGEIPLPKPANNDHAPVNTLKRYLGQIKKSISIAIKADYKDDADTDLQLIDKFIIRYRQTKNIWDKKI